MRINDQLRHPESRRLAGHLSRTAHSVRVLMNRMGQALERFPEDDMSDGERQKLLGDIESTYQDVPKMLLASAASVLTTLGSDEEHAELKTLERLADEQTDTDPTEMAAKLARLIAAMLERRCAARRTAADDSGANEPAKPTGG